MNLPLWQFGKARARPGTLRGSYTVLAAAPEFTDRHLAILRQISENVAWRPGGNSAYAPVTGCWPLSENDWLLLRFLDDGIDDHHRANTMRIEAALARGKPWDEVNSLVSSESWPAPVPDGETSVTLTAPSHSVEKPPRPTAPVLYGYTGELMNTLFVAPRHPVEMNSGSSAIPAFRAAPPPSGTTFPHFQAHPRKEKSPWRWITTILFFALLGCGFWINRQGNEITRLNGEYARQSKKNEDLISDKAARDRTIEENEKKLRKLKMEKDVLQSRYNDLESSHKDALPTELSRHYDELLDRFSKIREQFNSLEESFSNIKVDFGKVKETLKNASSADLEAREPQTNPEATSQ